MMIGVAQVIGMKPTLRSFFSGTAGFRKGLGRRLERKELGDRGERGRRADRFKKRPARGILRKHRAHDSRGNDALVTLLAACHRLASQRRQQPDHVRPLIDAGRTRSPLAKARDRHRRDRQRWTCLHFLTCRQDPEGQSRHVQRIHRPAATRGRAVKKHAAFYAAFSVSLASVGRPSSIGSEGSRDHSFQEPKYIRTSFTPAFFSARKVFDARAPLKQ